jgi:hypothetical protein
VKYKLVIIMPDRGRAAIRIPDSNSSESPVHNASWNKRAFSSFHVLPERYFILTLAKIGASFESVSPLLLTSCRNSKNGQDGLAVG